MMPWGRSRIATATPKHFVGAFAPFPRSTWIHADVPRDNYDRICEKIWRAANEAEEEFGRGASSPERQRDEECRRVADTPTHRAKEQQKEADDFGLSTRYEEDAQRHHTAFALPCPRLSGHRPPPVAEPARELKPVMEKEMKRAEEARGNAGLSRREEETGDGQTSVSNDVKGIFVPESTGRENNQSSEPHPQPPAPDPVCSATADRTLRPEDDEDPQHAACESRDGENTSSSCDSDDDDFVSLPGARSYGTDNSRGESESENDSDGEITEMLRSLEGAWSDSEQDSLCSSTAEEDFPLLSATKAGNPPRPTEPPACGKMQSHWEIPLSAWPCDFPAATLASCVTGRAHAPVRGKAGAPEASSLSNAPAAAAAPEEQPYNLLADFPALQPSKKPLALGVWRDGNPETKVAEGNRGHARTKIQCQGRGGSCRREIQIVPLEVPSVCTRDQKSVGNSPTVSGEELKASNQPTPRGTDGVDTNAKSWASVAKVGLE